MPLQDPSTGMNSLSIWGGGGICLSGNAMGWRGRGSSGRVFKCCRGGRVSSGRTVISATPPRVEEKFRLLDPRPDPASVIQRFLSAPALARPSISLSSLPTTHSCQHTQATAHSTQTLSSLSHQPVKFIFKFVVADGVQTPLHYGYHAPKAQACKLTRGSATLSSDTY